MSQEVCVCARANDLFVCFNGDTAQAFCSYTIILFFYSYFFFKCRHCAGILVVRGLRASRKVGNGKSSTRGAACRA
jgi:hypothetical protein